MGGERKKHIYYKETDREYYSSYFRVQFPLVIPWRYDEVWGKFWEVQKAKGLKVDCGTAELLSG